MRHWTGALCDNVEALNLALLSQAHNKGTGEAWAPRLMSVHRTTSGPTDFAGRRLGRGARPCRTRAPSLSATSALIPPGRSNTRERGSSAYLSSVSFS